jgi:hypothetical protein
MPSLCSISGYWDVLRSPTQEDVMTTAIERPELPTLSPMRPPIPSPMSERLSRQAWNRIRQVMTIGVFVTATFAGIAFGTNAPTISPVAPVVAAAAPMGATLPGPVPGVPNAAANRGGHRGGADPVGIGNRAGIDRR